MWACLEGGHYGDIFVIFGIVHPELHLERLALRLAAEEQLAEGGAGVELDIHSPPVVPEKVGAVGDRREMIAPSRAESYLRGLDALSGGEIDERRRRRRSHGYVEEIQLHHQLAVRDLVEVPFFEPPPRTGEFSVVLEEIAARPTLDGEGAVLIEERSGLGDLDLGREPLGFRIVHIFSPRDQTPGLRQLYPSF